MACLVYVDNTNLLELQGLKDALTGEFIDDATVTLVVVDEAGMEVAGQAWPWPMPPINEATDPTGNYRAILSDALEIVAGTTYLAVVDADAGPERIGHWEFAFVPKTRRAA